MTRGNSTAFDSANIPDVSLETAAARTQISLVDFARPSGPRTSRRLLRKLLRMRSALLSEF